MLPATLPLLKLSIVSSCLITFQVLVYWVFCDEWANGKDTNWEEDKFPGELKLFFFKYLKKTNFFYYLGT